MGRLASPRGIAKSCGLAKDSSIEQNGVAPGSATAAGATEHPSPPGPGRAGSRRRADGSEPLREGRHGW